MTELEKRSIIKDLVLLSRSDGEIDFSEASFIAKVAELLCLNNDDLEQVYLETDKVDFIPQKAESDRIIQFHRMVLLICADDVLENSEIVMVKKLGMRLGLNPYAVDAFLSELKKCDFSNGELPDTKKFFQTFHN